MLCVFEARARTSCNYSEGLRATSLLKGSSVRIINEKKLTHFNALYSAWDCIHQKIQMLRKCFQVGYVHSFLSSVWTALFSFGKKHFTCTGWAGHKRRVNCNTTRFKHFHITKFRNISLTYHLYIEKIKFKIFWRYCWPFI